MLEGVGGTNDTGGELLRHVEDGRVKSACADWGMKGCGAEDADA